MQTNISVASWESDEITERFKILRNAAVSRTYYALLRFANEISKQNNQYLEAFLFTVNYMFIWAFSYRIAPWSGDLEWIRLTSDRTWRWFVAAPSDLSLGIPIQEIFFLIGVAYVIITCGIFGYNLYHVSIGLMDKLRLTKLLTILLQLLRYIIILPLICLSGYLIRCRQKEECLGSSETMLLIAVAIVIILVASFLCLFISISTFSISPTKSFLSQSTNRHQVALVFMILFELLTSELTVDTSVVYINCIVSTLFSTLTLGLVLRYYPFYNKIFNFFMTWSIGSFTGTKTILFVLFILNDTSSIVEFSNWSTFAFIFGISTLTGIVLVFYSIYRLWRIKKKKKQSVWHWDIRLRMISWKTSGLKLKPNLRKSRQIMVLNEGSVADDPVTYEYLEALQATDRHPVILINYATYLLSKATKQSNSKYKTDSTKKKDPTNPNFNLENESFEDDIEDDSNAKELKNMGSIYLHQAQQSNLPIDLHMLLQDRIDQFGAHRDAELLEVQEMMRRANLSENSSRKFQYLLWSSFARHEMTPNLFSKLVNSTWQVEDKARNQYNWMLNNYPDNPSVLKSAGNFFTDFRVEKGKGKRMVSDAEEIDDNATNFTQSHVNSRYNDAQSEGSSAIVRSGTDTSGTIAVEEAGFKKRLAERSKKVTIFRIVLLLLIAAVIGSLIAAVVNLQNIRELYKQQTKIIEPIHGFRWVIESTAATAQAVAHLTYSSVLYMQDDHSNKTEAELAKDREYFKKADQLISASLGTIAFGSEIFAKDIQILTESSPNYEPMVDLWLRKPTVLIEEWQSDGQEFVGRNASLRDAAFSFQNALIRVRQYLIQNGFDLGFTDDSSWRYILRNSIKNFDGPMTDLAFLARKQFDDAVYKTLIADASTVLAIIASLFVVVVLALSVTIGLLYYEDKISLQVFKSIPKQILGFRIRQLRSEVDQDDAEELKEKVKNQASLKRRTAVQASLLILIAGALIMGSTIVQYVFYNYLETLPEAAGSLGSVNYHVARSFHMNIEWFTDVLIVQLGLPLDGVLLADFYKSEKDKEIGSFDCYYRQFRYGSENSRWNGAFHILPNEVFTPRNLSYPEFYCGNGVPISSSYEEQLEFYEEPAKLDSCYGMDQMVYDAHILHDKLSSWSSSVVKGTFQFRNQSSENIRRGVEYFDQMQRIFGASFKYNERLFKKISQDKMETLDLTTGLFTLFAVLLTPGVVVYFSWVLFRLSVELEEERRQVLRYLFHLPKSDLKNLTVVRQYLLSGHMSISRAKQSSTSTKRAAMSLLQASGDGVIAFDSSLNITEINPVAERIFETNLETSIGVAITDFIIESPEEDNDQSEIDETVDLSKANLRKGGSKSKSSKLSKNELEKMKPGSSVQFEMTLKRGSDKDGFPAKLSISCAEIENKRHYGMFVKDLTEEKMREKLIVTEKERSESLLLNILPEGIARRLKSGEQDISEEYPNCTVIFLDMVAFTSLSSYISPPELVACLNFIFSLFDRICKKWKVEKVKTIGDAYMAVSGLNRRSDHAQAAVSAAWEMLRLVDNLLSENPALEVIQDLLEMSDDNNTNKFFNPKSKSESFVAPKESNDESQEEMLTSGYDHRLDILQRAVEARKLSGEFDEAPISFRAGVNSGQVVGGVIGLEKFQFDIWGDTVNVASRMESTGCPGSVQISRSTYELTYSSFRFEERQVEVKGKGTMTTYICKEPKKQHSQRNSFHKALLETKSFNREGTQKGSLRMNSSVSQLDNASEKTEE
eukprot:gb/GECH01014792.1/.p1 GENE.gb/GECH01014792.1/~~gb/GECH01014792.1/.p1  ORF type:complete len:1744 (+),score=313.24 gb/GECH01014792.1/:1-5232(+)